jgi:hypothetical protein
MMEDFEDIRAGWKSHLFKRDGSKWRVYPATLTHEKLVLFKDEMVRLSMIAGISLRSLTARVPCDPHSEPKSRRRRISPSWTAWISRRIIHSSAPIHSASH